jgi:transposase
MILDAFIPYLQQRWREGCRKGVQLCQEIKARGFKGSHSTVLRYVRYLKLATAAGEIPPAPPDTSPLRRASVREVVWAMLCRPAKRDTTQQQLLAQLCEASPEIAQAHALSQEFQRLIRQRDLAGLEPWLEQAIRSQIPELRAFAVGLRREWEAIATTLCLPWSNGPVEGHIHRLKLLKRQMYGRAKFDLLRKRVILAG